MLITPEYAIAHIPKTGGHALAVMMTKAGFKFDDCPFKIKRDIVLRSNATKHRVFSSTPAYLLAGRKLLITIRQLPDWWKSYMWHQSKHIYINEKGNIAKDARQSYTDKNSPGFLFLPNLMCETSFPDKLLNTFLDFDGDISFLRMEYLIEDFYRITGKKLPEIPSKRYSYSPPTKYWSPDTEERLLENNPNWAGIQRELY